MLEFIENKASIGPVANSSKQFRLRDDRQRKLPLSFKTPCSPTKIFMQLLDTITETATNFCGKRPYRREDKIHAAANLTVDRRGRRYAAYFSPERKPHGAIFCRFLLYTIIDTILNACFSGAAATEETEDVEWTEVEVSRRFAHHRFLLQKRISFHKFTRTPPDESYR